MQLLDCFGIPMLMALSWFILYARYRVIHFVAVAVCLLGVGTMVGADILARRDNSGKTVTSFWFSPREKFCLGFHFYFLNTQYNAGNMPWLTIFSNFIFRFTCFWYSDHFHKASLCSYLPTVLVPFCHTGFV